MVKILSLPFKTTDNVIKEFEIYNIEIKPKFNRNGWYYNRYEKISWVEFNERAWLYNSSYFLYTLKQLNHKPLTPKTREAIKILINQGIDKKNLIDLLITDNDYFNFIKVKRNTKKILFRI